MKAAGVIMENICHWTAVSERSVQWIVSTFLKTGSWGVPKKQKLRVGKLDVAAVEVHLFLVFDTCTDVDLSIGPC